MYVEHAPLPYKLIPTLRASNAEVVQHPADRAQGTLVIGGQGSGKTSFLLRSFLNDCRDPNCAPVLIDPKSEVARLALALIPPDCGKQVWFLNLAYPRFGMSPLWLPTETMRSPRRLANAVTGIADNVVNSLLDVNEGQLFQASRDVLYHATIGALALAAARDTRPSLEDIYALMLPYRADLRKAVVEAISTLGAPDLDQTKEYWDREIPDMLQGAPTLARQRLAPPRNKVGGIVAVPPLRRFFNHPVELPLSRIIENRDILIVDAAMGGPEERPGIGEENSVACIHFILRMLHTFMQRQIHLAPPLRTRVALNIEECHYIVNETTIDMMATHRAAGLDVTLVHQFFAQLMAESTGRSEKIRKGILNLCQSRLLFRLGDPDDAEQAARITMAVYDSLIRSDPDARARMRGTPETLLQLVGYYCAASLIALRQRAPSFIGQTYAMPRGLGYTRIHYQRMVDALGASYPEHMRSTYKRTIRRLGATAVDDAEQDDEQLGPADDVDVPDPPVKGVDREDEPAPPTAPEQTADDPDPPASSTREANDTSRSRRERRPSSAQPELWEPVEPERAKEVLTSRALDLAGRRLREGDYPLVDDAETPATLAELAVFDQLSHLKHQEADARKPLRNPGEKHIRVLQLLDCFDFLTTAQLARAVWPENATERTVQMTLARMQSAGLLQRTQPSLNDQPLRHSPALWSLTRAGFKLGQAPPARLLTSVTPIAEGRRFRASRAEHGSEARHDLHVVNWLQAFGKVAPAWVTPYWRTPRHHNGRFRPPHVGQGRGRRPLRAADIWLGEGYAFAGIPTDDWQEIKPDLCIELHVVSDPAPRPGRRYDLRFDLLLEVDLTRRAAYNEDKLKRYDAFLTGWALEHARVKEMRTRPILVITTPTPRTTLTLMRTADRVLNGRIGLLGTPDHEWYYPARDHILFAVESDVHHGSLRALKLPQLPFDVRRGLRDDSFTVEPVGILPHTLLRAARNRSA